MRSSIVAGILLCSVTICNLLASPVSENGALKRQGSKIVGAHGKEVQLAGPSLYWSIWGGQNYYTNGAVTTVAADWNASLIRAAIAVENAGGYLEKPAQQITYAKSVIDAAIANGIYILVDWHDHNANLHIPEAKNFFSQLAEAYKNTPNVIWEIWNEPDNTSGTGTNGADTWDDIRNYADSILPVIRQHSSNLIVVGTPNWSADPATAAANPLNDSNVAYALHFYAGTHGASVRKNAESAMSKGAAVFITEFGTTDASGGKTDSTLFFDETKTWLDWADFNGISWANWSLSAINEPCSELNSGASTTGVWTDSDLSTSGKWIRGRLLSRPASQTTDTAVILTAVQGKGSITLSPAGTRVIKGTQITFTAVPLSGWVFKSWDGASSSIDTTVTLTINKNTLLTAIFSPDAGNNMLLNGDCSDDSAWFLWVDTANGNNAVTTFTDSQVNVSITSTDTLNWGIQLTQGNLELINGATYTIILDAWSTEEREIFVGLSTAKTWHFQGGEICRLTSAKKTFTITIVPDSTTNEGIFQINFGGSLLPVFVDNIQMSKAVESKTRNVHGVWSPAVNFRTIGDRINWTPVSKQTRVSLMDISGRTVVPSTANNPLLLSTVPHGMYLFVIKDGIQRQVFRISR